MKIKNLNYLVAFFALLPLQGCKTTAEKLREIKISNNLTCTLAGHSQNSAKYIACKNLLDVAREESRFIPPLNPETLRGLQNKVIVIYNHGTSSLEHRRNCRPKNAERIIKRYYSRKIENMDVHFYYFCSSVSNVISASGISRYSDPSDWKSHISFDREKEIIKLVDRFLDAGVKPEHLFLAGQSMGSWSSLRLAASYPEKINSVIAFSPGCCGQTVGLRGYDIVTEMRQHLVRSKYVNAYVISHKDDPYNSVWINRGLFDDIRGLKLKMVPASKNSACAKVRNPHNLQGNRCTLELLPEIRRFISTRLKGGGFF